MRITESLRHPAARDVGLVLLLLMTSVLLGATAESPRNQLFVEKFGLQSEWYSRLALWWLASIPAIAALLVRRYRPVTAVLLAAASASAHLTIPDLAFLPIDLAALVTIYTMATGDHTRRRSLTTLATAVLVIYLGCLALVAQLGPPLLDNLVKAAPPADGSPPVILAALTEAIGPALALSIAWVVGDNIRTRRMHLATLEMRALDLQRERDTRAALAVSAERARITRELHDVVAHGISVMVVQAQGAAAALRNHPDRTATALDHIVHTGRSSLAEMRRLLGMVRGDVQLAPQPGIGALPALIDEVRDAGTPVTLKVEGEPVPLATTVDLSAYRIVQEALTNTRKHAGPGAKAVVRLTFTPDHLEVEVVDDGTTATAVELSTVDGNGIRGIAERVTTLNGSLHIGPRDEGGFVVRALLPIAIAP